MTEPSNAELIERVLRLDGEATPGTWRVTRGSAGDEDTWVSSNAERAWNPHMALKLLWVRKWPYENKVESGVLSNASLIAHYRTDAPLLARRLQEAERTLEAADRLLERSREALSTWESEREKPVKSGLLPSQTLALIDEIAAIAAARARQEKRNG